jgi:hypothetical protein
MRLPPHLETLGWSDPAHSTYRTFASFDCVSSTTRALPNALTVFLNVLMARRILSRYGEFSHGTVNAPANVPANARVNAPVNAPTNAQQNAHPSVPVSAPRALTNAHRAEAFIIPTQVEAALTLPSLY